MIKKTITYTDYNGSTRTEDFYFNLSKAEMVEMETSTKEGLSTKIKQIADSGDNSEMVKILKDLILKAYGEKSPDGKRFMKNDEIRTAFTETEAYSVLFIELTTNVESATAFFNGLAPASNA